MTTGDEPERSVEPDIVERELTGQDYVAIELALRTKRGIGWVHAMGLVRRLQDLQEDLGELRSRGTAGEPRR